MRKLSEIAADIKTCWGVNTSRHAAPYIEAMSELVDIDQTFYYDSAESVVRYFLANAGGWRGEDARRIKSELKEMLNSQSRGVKC